MTRHLRAEMALNLRILLRLPGFWVPTVIFPAMLYAFFGSQSGGGLWGTKAMASFCVYAVLGVGFFQFGVSIAQDRESPFDSWQRSLPGSIANQWIARIFAALIFVSAAVSLVIATALATNDISLSTANWVWLAVVCLASVAPATLMGIALGSFTSARAAVPIANLVYLPLAYLGGLWVPPIAMPVSIERISKWTPTRAMGELSWSAVSGHSVDISYLISLGAWTAAAVGMVLLSKYRTPSV